MAQTDNKKYLVSFDTDRIKDYIFATNSLKEIRGASALLVEIEESRRKDLQLPEDSVAFSAGGGGAIEADDAEKGEELRAEIERHFQAKTVSGSITTVMVPPGLNGKRLTFQQQMRLAMEKMGQTKAAKAPLFHVPLEPYMRPCMACGMLAAEMRYNRDSMGDLLCNACASKRDKGLEVRQDKKRGYVGQFRTHVKSHHKNKAGDWLKADLAKDLTHLAELDGSRYIGFIMIDGNNMGKLLEHLKEKEHYKAYSDTLKETVEHLVYDAILSEGDPIHNTLPFEVVLIGGDDVMIFTAAKLAMPFALAVLKGFEESTKAILDAGHIPKDDRPEQLTMSSSVVYAHGNFPIPALVEIGEALQKSAKIYADTYKRKNGKEVSAIDFALITGSMLELETERELSRAMRPFTRTSMEKLSQFAAQLKVPPSQLHRVYEACVSGRLVDGTMATLQMMGRLRDGRQREMIKELLSTFSTIGEGKEFIYWPWTRLNGNSERASILVDLIELHRFTEKEKNDGQ